LVREQSRKNGKSPGKAALRTRRYILASIAFLCLALVATQIFLNQTSVGSTRFVPGTILLWTTTVLVVLALLILATVLGRNLIKIYFERKSGQVGSRFKSKMVSTFVVLSLLPALLLFFLAYGLINFSVQQWFSAPATQMMDNSTAIAQQYYDETRQRLEHFAGLIASGIQEKRSAPFHSQQMLGQDLLNWSREYRIDSVRIFDQRGELFAEAGDRISREEHRPQVAKMVAAALSGNPGAQVQRVSPEDALEEVAWATAPIRAEDGQITGAVLTETLIPESIYFKAYSVREAHDVYQQLRKGEAGLTYNILMILALATLLIVFAFSWFAMYLAKRITVPIQALAEGAMAVAAGKLDYRVDCTAFDELENLVTSFNRMTAELEENKRNIEGAQNDLRHTNVVLDERRRYIETILQTIATGVISLDANYRIRTLNPAAAQMLEISVPARDLPLDQVITGPACDALRMMLHKSAMLGTVVRNIELNLPGKSLHLATTVTPLVDASGQRTGWVLVLDDLTELLRVEKMAAWQEVARRLAHEIKNPLTPIQLSAERVLNRYRQIKPPAGNSEAALVSCNSEFSSFENLLRECVGTITQEASSLKNLVDEFTRFARLPAIRPEETDLHQILDSALSLHNGRIQAVRIDKEFDSRVPRLNLDPGQMKRVFINLFDNALEAMADIPHHKVLQIRTSRSSKHRSVTVEISDTGRGFPEEYRDSLFLPYFSTRKGGTGLGLAIVRQIVTEHHGRVRAEPNLPMGTKIIIDLPLAAQVSES